MKNVKMMIFAASVLFFATGAAHAVEMDDLGVTIKMINSDDMKGISRELHLPDAASDIAREHAEGRDGKGLSRANEVHNRNEARKDEHDAENAGNDHSTDQKDENDDHKSSHDKVRDSHEDVKDGQLEMHNEAKDAQEALKEEHTETHHEDDHDGVREDLKDSMDNPTDPIASP